MNLNKSAEEFLPDLNLQAINLKFAQIVAFYKTYNLCNFQLDTFKIKAWPIENAKA